MEFLAIIFLVVYVGAIAVLFLFVVMMLNVRLIELNEKLLSYFPFTCVLGIIFTMEIYNIFFNIKKFSQIENNNNNRRTEWLEVLFSANNIKNIGQVLYTVYIDFFFISGFILLIAMVSAISLTLFNPHTAFKKQNIFRQSSTNFYKQVKNFSYIQNSPQF
jgi:NADH-quinone oxidoreductase subunit J